MPTCQAQASPSHAREGWWEISPMVSLALRTLAGDGETEAPHSVPGISSFLSHGSASCLLDCCAFRTFLIPLWSSSCLLLQLSLSLACNKCDFKESSSLPLRRLSPGSILILLVPLGVKGTRISHPKIGYFGRIILSLKQLRTSRCNKIVPCMRVCSVVPYSLWPHGL